MNKSLLDVINYLKNHSTYDYLDIPEEDLEAIETLYREIIKAVKGLEKDKRFKRKE